MTNDKVIIAGGGIGGLTLGLTFHQIGVPFVVLETWSEMRPLGVGINIQPNAVRELFDLGLTADILDTIGVPVKEWALVGLNGREVYAESRAVKRCPMKLQPWPAFIGCHPSFIRRCRTISEDAMPTSAHGPQLMAVATKPCCLRC